jgi:hypothetical protein
MRSNEVFQRMTPEEAASFLEELRGESPGAATLALGAAANAFKLRPQFLRKQPRAKQADWVRKALSRPTSAAAAEEVLADYFLGSQKELLVELLDVLGLEHDEGSLKEANPPSPSKKKRQSALKKFREGESPERRSLLLRSFAAQSAIDWPELDSLV